MSTPARRNRVLAPLLRAATPAPARGPTRQRAGGARAGRSLRAQRARRGGERPGRTGAIVHPPRRLLIRVGTVTLRAPTQPPVGRASHAGVRTVMARYPRPSSEDISRDPGARGPARAVPRPPVLPQDAQTLLTRIPDERISRMHRRFSNCEESCSRPSPARATSGDETRIASRPLTGEEENRRHRCGVDGRATALLWLRRSTNPKGAGRWRAM